MKSLGYNAIYNMLYKSLNILFPLVTMAYVSRVLLPVGVGKVASAQNIVSYFVILASLGLPTYGVKKIAECSDNKNNYSKVFTELTIINAVSTLICICAYLILVFQLGYFENKIAISMIVGIQLFANFFNIDWFYQGLEEYRYIMFRSLFIKLLSLAFVFLFVHEADDVIIYALIVTLSLVANYLFNVVHLNKLVRFKFSNLKISSHIKPVCILLASTIAIEIYTLADITMLNVIKGDEVVGYYTNSAKTIGISRTMIAAASAVFLPRLNFYLSHGNINDFKSLAIKGLYMLLTFSLPVSIGLLLLADNCTFILFGRDYEASILSMRILAFSIVTVAVSNFTGYQILVSLGKEKVVLKSTVIGAVVNVVLNSLLIFPYGHYGAALASVITELVVAVYQLFNVKKIITLSFGLLYRQILVPLLAMMIVICLIKLLSFNIYIEVLTAVIMGGFVYLLFCIVNHNETIQLIRNKIKI